MITTFTIDLNVICAKCGQHHAISGTTLCPHCTPEFVRPSGAPVPPSTATTPRQPAADSGHPPEDGRTERVRGLAGSLLSLILRVERSRDRQFHSLLLPRGLIIEIGIGEEFNLRLARRDSTPSHQEWRTVIAALPAAYQPADPVTPHPFTHTARDNSTKWYLDGHWPLKKRH